MENNTFSREVTFKEHANIKAGRLSTFLDIPSTEDYYDGMNIFTVASLVYGIFLFILSFVIFLFTQYKIRKNVSKTFQPYTLMLCAIYPVINFAGLLVLFSPNLFFISHTIMHSSFSICAYVFYKLCFLYAGGENNFLKNTETDTLDLRTPPMCCCCICCKPITPNKSKLCIIHYMIGQLVFFQILILIVLNIIYFKEPEIFDDAQLYFVPFTFGSIFIALWGLNIITRMLQTHLSTGYKLRAKFICLQLVLVCCKLQPIIIKNAVFNFIDLGNYPITHTVYRQITVDLLILTEMTILSLWAQNLYRNSIVP